MKRDTFSEYHPLVNFVFFIGAILFGMFLLHPAFLACSLLLSASCYVTVRRWKSVRYIAGLIGLFVILSLLNPLLNTYGERVLFTYLGGRCYTLEALLYGMALAAMLVSVLLWFASYNAVMTSDKFLYLFGKLAPSVSLILTMTLRLIPSYRKKTEQVSGARRCIGMGMAGGSITERLRQSFVILSALMSWALEGGIITADSMKSRGFGCGKRTSFSIYSFGRRDRILLGLMTVLLGVLFFCTAQGGAYASFTPGLVINGAGNPYTVAGIISYIVFLGIPTIVNLLEELSWYILRSGI